MGYYIAITNNKDLTILIWKGMREKCDIGQCLYYHVCISIMHVKCM